MESSTPAALQQVKQIEVTACSRHGQKLAAGMTSRQVLKIDKPLIQ